MRKNLSLLSARYRLTETWHDRRNAAQKAELYANTPKHGPTRQQRRAAGKAWKNSPARKEGRA